MIPLEKKLLDMLSNNNVTFFIPPFQRNYEWDLEQCGVFWRDIVKTYSSNSANKHAEHFFGTVTYYSVAGSFFEPGKLVLIDGQQRITTTMLFLAALRDILEGSEYAEMIDAKLLKNDKAHGDGEYKIKLKQVETDWNAYKKIILKLDSADADQKSAICQNYEYFRQKIEEVKPEIPNLGKLIDLGLKEFSVIAIELEPTKNPWENPQEIFESMNSLGKPLTLADLVRNYLLLGLNTDDQTELYDQYWLHIEKTLPHEVSNFIRDYMQAYAEQAFEKATEPNYKKLYSAFKDRFGEIDRRELMKDLYECSTLYAQCIGLKSTGSDDVDKKLSDLIRMKVTTAYSFIMVLLRTWKSGKMKEYDIVVILDAFRTYCLRRRLLGIAQAENKNFPLYVRWIDELAGAHNKKRCMFEKLANQESNLRIPNDREMQSFMQTMNFANFRHAKFYLALIEEKTTKSRPDLSDPRLQLEHIMPQQPTEKWGNIKDPSWIAMHQELVNSLGNLTLIRHNQELGNKSFGEKKECYSSDEGLAISRNKIIDKDEWTPAAIRERTDWLINTFLTDIFPIPSEMKYANNFNIKQRNSGALSFNKLGLIGKYVQYKDDPTITALVVDDVLVEYGGTRWKLSPLTIKLKHDAGKMLTSKSARGAEHWSYQGKKLVDLMKNLDLGIPDEDEEDTIDIVDEDEYSDE